MIQNVRKQNELGVVKGSLRHSIERMPVPIYSFSNYVLIFTVFEILWDIGRNLPILA